MDYTEPCGKNKNNKKTNWLIIGCWPLDFIFNAEYVLKDFFVLHEIPRESEIHYPEFPGYNNTKQKINK